MFQPRNIQRHQILASDASDSHYTGAYVSSDCQQRASEPYSRDNTRNYKRNYMAEKIQEKAQAGARAVMNLMLWATFAVLFMINAYSSIGQEPRQLFLLSNAIQKRLERSDPYSIVYRRSVNQTSFNTSSNASTGLPEIQYSEVPTAFWREINNFDDMWEYFQNHFMKVLHEEKFEEDATPTILRFNKLVGPMQLRQIRSHVTKCTLLEELAGITDCVADIGRSCQHQSKETYSPADDVELADLTPFTYASSSSSSLLQSDAQLGQAGYQYPTNSGYTAYMDSNRSVAEATLQGLRNAGWVDRHTRALFMESIFYNANLQTLILVRMALEAPLSGGMLPWITVETSYIGDTKVWVYVVQAIFALGVAVWTMLELDQMMLLRFQYLRLWQYVCPCTATLGGAVCGKVLKCRICKLRWLASKTLLHSPITFLEEDRLKKGLSKIARDLEDTESVFKKPKSKKLFLGIKFRAEYQTATALVPYNLYRDQWKCKVCHGEFENEFERHKSRCLYARAASGPSFDSSGGSLTEGCSRLPIRVPSPQSWKYIELLQLLFVWAVISVKIILYIWKRLCDYNSLLTSSDAFTQVEGLIGCQQLEQTLSAIVIILHLVLLSKHMQFFPGFRFLSWVLNYSFASILALMGFIVVMLVFFAFSFHLLSGSDLMSYSSLSTSVTTLLLVLFRQRATDDNMGGLPSSSIESVVLSWLFFLLVVMTAVGSVVGIFTNAVRSALLALQRASGKPTPVGLYWWQVCQHARAQWKGWLKWTEKRCCCSWVRETSIWDEGDTLNDAKTLQQGRIHPGNAGPKEEIETSLQKMNLDQLADIHSQVMYYFNKRLDETIQELGVDS